MASTVWRGFLTFGLISVPIRLFRAARAERVSFRRVYRASPESPLPNEPEFVDRNEPKQTAQSRPGPVLLRRAAAPPARVEEPEPVFEPVKQADVRRSTGEVIQPASVAKGYEVEKGRYVVIEPEELKSIAPKTATEMEINEFVRLSEIDPVYFENSYYVVPEQAGGKAYGLLYKALQEAGLVALAQIAMHNREHVMVVRPGKKGLVAHTMFYQSEVRSDEEFAADVTGVSAKELQLAHQLIEGLAATFAPEKYRDTYREKLEEIIANKRAGLPARVESAPVPSNSVSDITDALQRSLAALKKSPGKTTTRTPKSKQAVN